MIEIGPLRRRMTENMTVGNLSPAAQRFYISAVSKFGLLAGRRTDSLWRMFGRFRCIWLPKGSRAWVEPSGLRAAVFLRRYAAA